MNKKPLFDGQVIVRLTDGHPAAPGDVAVAKEVDGNLMRLSVKNTGTGPLSVKEIAMFAGQTGLADATKFYAEGYHMLTQYRGNMNDREVIGAYGDDKTFFSLPHNPFDKDLFVLYYLLHLMEPDGTDTLIGFTSCNRFLGKFRLRGGYLEIVQDCEDLILDPGESWQMEELYIGQGAPCDLYDALAARIGVKHPAMPWDTIPTGWCSYYCMGRMDPDGLYQNARAMAARIPELQMIQVDAGTCPTDGDWLIPRFSDDLATICAKIRAEGVTAGGYFSPFLVNVESQLCAQHPDWLVTDEQGNPTNRCSHNKNWYILDGTHPDARAYLKQIVRYMHDECQLRYFKLDFLSYGALPAGLRHDRTKTSVEAYRMGMQAIVEEIGDDSFVLACNAPFWPTLGLCHGNRTTNDIFRDWKHVGGNALEQFYRNWQHQTLWINDPDCIVLERLDMIRWRNGQQFTRPCTLTDAEFEFHKAFAIACGGMILSGDLLYELSDKSRDELIKMMDAMGEAARFDDDTFTIGRFGQKPYLCLFNWTEELKTICAPISGKKTVHDLWTGELVGEYTDTLCVVLPPHGGRVFELRL